MLILRLIKKIINIIGYYFYKLKCECFYYLHGGQGLSYAVENLPNLYIVPILKSYGATIGERSDIDTGLILHRIVKKKDIQKLSIGNRTHIGHNMILDLTSCIEIGSNTAFGANCQIWTHTGNWTINRDDETDIINSVLIGESVICYSGVIISQNVTIGDYSRVAAGSVVINNIDEKTFVGGVPAKIIKTIIFRDNHICQSQSTN